MTLEPSLYRAGCSSFQYMSNTLTFCLRPEQSGALWLALAGSYPVALRTDQRDILSPNGVMLLPLFLSLEPVLLFTFLFSLILSLLSSVDQLATETTAREARYDESERLNASIFGTKNSV
jgi:hypothetical protein